MDAAPFSIPDASFASGEAVADAIDARFEDVVPRGARGDEEHGNATRAETEPETDSETAENAAAEALAFAGNATDAVEAFAATETAEPAAAVTSDAARSDETVSLFDAAPARAPPRRRRD